MDAGEGKAEYLPLLDEAMRQCGAKSLQEIIITHWHRDHVGGVKSIMKHFGTEFPVRKLMTGAGSSSAFDFWPEEKFLPLRDGDTVRTQGAELRVIHTPGHASDHIVMVHEQDRSMFSGDNVLGVESMEKLSRALAPLELQLEEATARERRAEGRPMSGRSGARRASRDATQEHGKPPQMEV